MTVGGKMESPSIEAIPRQPRFLRHSINARPAEP
jgi:hypothetical protein